MSKTTTLVTLEDVFQLVTKDNVLELSEGITNTLKQLVLAKEAAEIFEPGSSSQLILKHIVWTDDGNNAARTNVELVDPETGVHHTTVSGYNHHHPTAKPANSDE